MMGQDGIGRETNGYDGIHGVHFLNISINYTKILLHSVPAAVPVQSNVFAIFHIPPQVFYYVHTMFHVQAVKYKSHIMQQQYLKIKIIILTFLSKVFLVWVHLARARNR